jgi:hypothetical protein
VKSRMAFDPCNPRHGTPCRPRCATGCEKCEEYRAYMRAKYQKNPEKHRDRARDHYRAVADRYRILWASLTPEQKEARYARNRANWWKNPEHARERLIAWRYGRWSRNAESYEDHLRIHNEQERARYATGYRRVRIESTQRAFGRLVPFIDGMPCSVCMEPIFRLEANRRLRRSLDHKIPVSIGGKHEADNFAWTHIRCNASKGARVFEGKLVVILRERNSRRVKELRGAPSQR